MQQKINQKGITLVIVLLMITVFSILGLSVIGYAISNAKQAEKSEQEMQATDLAEMGVVYYKNIFTNNAANTLINVVNTVNGEKLNPADVEGEFYNQINQSIDKFIPTDSNSKLIKENPPFKYEIETTKAFLTDHIIAVNFTSKGMVGNNVIKNLSVTINVKVDQLVNIDGNGFISIGEGGSSGGSEWDGTVPAAPSGLPVCPTRNANDECYTFGDYTFPKDINGLTTYVGGNMTLTEGTSQVENTHIYASGDGNFGNLNGGIINSTIYIGGAANFGNLNGGIQNSTIFIYGNAIFGNLKDGIDHSTIYIMGDVTFDKSNIEVFSNDSKVCVRGTSNQTDPRLFSKVADPDAYNANCLISDDGSGENDLRSAIYSQLDDLDINYN